MKGTLDPELVISGKFSLKPMLSIISGKVKEIGAKRIVLDALDVLLGLFENPLQVRGELHQLNNWLMDSGLTSIITLKPRENAPTSLFQDFFFSVADCVINLDVRVLNQISTRRLRAVKYRGSSFGRNEYPFIISAKGMRTIPITKFELKHKPFGGRISSMVDTVIFISYIHGEGETNRTIQILKARGSKHTNQVREFRIDDGGIQIRDLYLGPGGVLTGTARQIQEAKDAVEIRQKEAEIQLKVREISRLKAEAEAQAEIMRYKIEALEAEVANLQGEIEKANMERNERAKLRGWVEETVLIDKGKTSSLLKDQRRKK